MIALWSGSPASAASSSLANGSPDGRSDVRWHGALTEARAGSEFAFAQLIRAHQRTVYSLALRALGAAAEAEELAQDVFLQLYLALERIESPAHLVYWLRRTVTHRAIDRLRQRGRRPPPQALTATDPDTPLGERSASPFEDPLEVADPLLARRLERHVAALPAVARLVVLLRFQEDLDPAEIARVLDLSVNTVKSHLKRSLARLRADLRDRDT
ncbi:MAG TPA: sigma-70 family RNA polymerase sigma factor [Steroidobacteraceae bacterium]|nr:sigma-70 family RNA polymerase sigma factor [Steroidobacteraceae bacterium]